MSHDAVLIDTRALLLVVDVQEKFVPKIARIDEVIDGAVRMIRAAAVLELPVLLTEQYPKGLGTTCSAIRETLGADGYRPIEKTVFSACVDPVRERLGELGRNQVILVGIETHVCIQQTTFDLLRLGYQPFVCADAVGSRREFDYDIALLRMQQAGAIITTTESIIFEALREAGTDTFRRVLPIVK